VGYPKDLDKAEEYFGKAAVMKHPDADLVLGNLLLRKRKNKVANTSKERLRRPWHVKTGRDALCYVCAHACFIIHDIFILCQKKC
jgi:TPR repeat protein